MAIFPRLKTEATVQVDDKTRLDSTDIFITVDEAAVTLVEIEPFAGNGFIDVTGSGKSKEWFLDWVYATDGTIVATVRVTTDGAPVSFTQDIVIITELDDNLFSNDKDIVSLEPNILNFNDGGARAGRDSFLDVHREAQTQIIEWLNNYGYQNTDGTKIDKTQIIDTSDYEDWSRYLTLRLIHEGVSNQVGDIFFLKANNYGSKEIDARDRAYLRIDFNKDGEITEFSEKTDVKTLNLRRVK